MPPPARLLCSICQEICKRASKIPCCGAQCCWGCGVRTITRNRKCWNCPNITVVTGDLGKDNKLRDDISKYSRDIKEAEVEDTQGNGHSAHILEQTGAVDNVSEKPSEGVESELTGSKKLNSPPLKQIVEPFLNSTSEDFGKEDSKPSLVKNSDNEVAFTSLIDSSIEKSTTKTVFTKSESSSRIDLHRVEISASSISHLQQTVLDNSEKDETLGCGTLVKQHIQDKEIDEVTSLSKEETVVLKRDGIKNECANENPGHIITNIKSVCDTNIPEGSEELIHPVEKPSSKSSSPIKIELKSNFKKLSEKVTLIESPSCQSEKELEMFKNNLPGNTPEEVRIVKMVEDLDKKEKIVRIIEELDKTKSLSKRRQSSDTLGPDKRASPAKAEAAPITNALQGLQALLKMSKISDTSGSTKETDVSSEKKCQRSRNVSASTEKSSPGGDYSDTRSTSTSRRNSDSLEHKSRKSEIKTRHGDHKDSKSRHIEPPALTRINRSALVRDKQVETHTKTLVEEQNNRKNVVEDLQAVSGHNHDCYEAGRSKNKFQSFQMKDIRKRLLPGPKSINTISSRASEVAKRKGKEEEDEVKVISYRMVKPKIENDENHERIIRKVVDTTTLPKTEKGKSKSESSRNSDGASKKVKKVPKDVSEVSNNKSEEIDKIEGKTGQRSMTNSEASINLFQKSIVKIQSQEYADDPNTTSEGKKSLDLIKEELERVTTKVNDIKKKSTSKEISSDDDMKVIMKDVEDIEDMEESLNELTEEPEDGRRSKSKKKKHKDDRKKKKKSKYAGDIAIDSRIAKKIISRIISSDMGKSFNEAIKQEVGETQSTIEKIREDLRKKSCPESKPKKKSKRGKSKEGKDKKKKRKDRHGDEENPRDTSHEKKKKKRSKERSISHSEDAGIDQNQKKDLELSPKSVEIKADTVSISKNYKKRKSRSPVRYYDQVPDVIHQEKVENASLVENGKKSKKVKYEEERNDNHKKKKSKKKHKRQRDKEVSDKTESNKEVAEEVSTVVESKTDSQERIVRKKSCSPSKDFDLVLGVAEEDLLEENISSNEKKTVDAIPDSIIESEEIDTTIDSNVDENKTDVPTKVIDAALEDIPAPEDTTEANTSFANSGATSSVNSEDEQSEDEDNLRALLLSQLSKTRCGPKTKSKKKSSTQKITKISWSSPPPEPVEVSSTTPSVPPTPSYPPLGSLPVYAYAYSRTFITPAEKLLYFPNLYNRVLVPLDQESDSDSDCQSDCDSYWGEKRTSQWVSDRMAHNQGFSEADPRFSQANLNLVMRGRESCSPAPN